ncbi:MAG: galactokinase [Brevefilum sp.]
MKKYFHHYHSKPAILVMAPGRINLIGEHTDYSDGFVLPVAINLGVAIAMTPRNDHRIKLYSMDLDEHIEFDLGEINKKDSGWQEYIKGVAWALQEESYNLQGWQGVVAGSIPIGAGLSSSAALLVATVEALCVSSNLSLSEVTVAKIGRRAESEWVGVNVGIMDQLVSAAGKADHAVCLDCRTMAYEYVPIPEKVHFLVLDTLTRRELSHSAYNRRHEEIKEATKKLGVSMLRDASLSLLNEKGALLSDILFRRAKHVISENERVLAFREAMKNQDLQKMGALINASHRSLRDDFEVSSKELNLIVDIAQNQPACLGARMTGAGFGGCALAILEDGNVDDFIKAVSKTYQAETKIEPYIFKIESEDGVKAFDLLADGLVNDLN